MISGQPDYKSKDLKLFIYLQYIFIFLLVSELQENTEYYGYDKNSKIVEWFWEILKTFDRTERCLLL